MSRPQPGVFNNGFTAKHVPKMNDELVVIPLFWKVKEKRFGYATDFPWQLKGIMSPQEYSAAIIRINQSLETPRQRRLNLLCFFCFGCCNICCKPDPFLVAKEMVFEPRGLSLRGPRMKDVPLNSGFGRPDGPKQTVTWLEIQPSVNGRSAVPMGSVQKRQEKKKAKREQKRAKKKEKRRHDSGASETKQAPEKASLPGAMGGSSKTMEDAGSEGTSDSDSDDSEDSIPEVTPMAMPANAPTAGVKAAPEGKQEQPVVPHIVLHNDLDDERSGFDAVKARTRKSRPKPKHMTEQDRRQAMLDAMPLSEAAKEAIRRRQERGNSPRRRHVVASDMRPHPMSHKLVGGQGIEDTRYIEEQRKKEAEEAEKRRRKARQEARKAAKIAREQKIKMAAAAAAKAAADAISMGHDPFAMPAPAGYGMPVGGAAPMMMPTSGYVQPTPAAMPYYAPQPAAVPVYGAAPAMYGVAAAATGASRMAIVARSSHALQQAGASAFATHPAQPPLSRSMPTSTQKTPRGGPGGGSFHARRPRTNSTGSYHSGGSKWQGARAAASFRTDGRAGAQSTSPTARNLQKVASELNRLRGYNASPSPSSGASSAGLRTFGSTGSMRGAGETR